MQAYDLEKMKKLLHDFYFLTGIKICIYDSSENELCYYPEKYSPFCAALRKDPDMERRCLECDRNAFAVCKKTRRQHMYTCHAGLFECVSPVLYGDFIVGYIAVGQIRTDDTADFAILADRFGSGAAADLRRSFEELPVFNRDTIDAAVNILDACAGYEYLKTLIRTEADPHRGLYRLQPRRQSERAIDLPALPAVQDGTVCHFPGKLRGARGGIYKKAQAEQSLRTSEKHLPARRRDRKTVRDTRLQLFFQGIQAGDGHEPLRLSEKVRARKRCLRALTLFFDVFNDLCGNACGDRVCGHIPRDDRARRDDGVVADRNAGQERCVRADPYVSAQPNRSGNHVSPFYG